MSDFFEEPAAMQEMDQSAAHHLVVEARAELNTVERDVEKTIEVHRSIGEKFIKIRDLLGRYRYLPWTAKRMKISERQIQRIIKLAESSPSLPIDQQIAILWGNEPKEPKAATSQGEKAAKPVEPKQIWKHVNGIVEGVGTLVNAGNLQTDEDYIGVRDTIKGLKSHLRALIKKAEGK